MKTALLDYNLPPGLIADRPSRVRRHCRLLHLDRATGEVTHYRFDDLPTLLQRDDLLVVNDTAVIPARLIGKRVPGGGEAEIFLTEKLGARRWRALVRPGRRLRPGAVVGFGEDASFCAHIESADADGVRIVRFAGRGRFQDWLQRQGVMPLPPYIRRPVEPSDRRDYQTVFARHEGAVAAPTAGLHFDPPLLTRLKTSGVAMATVTLHVGPGTFRPVRTATIEEHHLDSERFHVGVRTQKMIRSRRRSGHGRVIAVGTTVTRTLESIRVPAKARSRAKQAETLQKCSALDGRTDLLIVPGHGFVNVDGLITNFHLPRSSLLALVAAFAGLEPVMHAYHVAIASGYRFYSYGDAMLIL